MKTYIRWLLVLCAATLSVSPTSIAQGSSASTSAIPVFLDCSYLCDESYLHTQITYVDWVRDRSAADVDVLVSVENTAAQGSRYTFTFIGEHRFAALDDTLEFNTVVGASSDDVRRAMTRVLKQGLVRYATRTALRDRMTVSVQSNTQQSDQTTPRRDPWHAWVYTTSVNGYVFAEALTRSTSMSGSVSASRTTANWKLQFSGNESYDESRYTVESPDTTFVNIQRGFGFSSLAVKSLGRHWSAGLKGSVTSSTYLNEKQKIRLTPAVEYDVMPYSESTRRQLRIQYGIGADALAYNDTTIFLKTRETLPLHTLVIAYAQREPWGSVNMGVDASSYLNDGSKRNATLSGGGSINIVRGLNFNLSGSYSLIHDQIYLAKGTATQTEVLLQQRQLLTGYQWNAFFGLSYTFGSLFNNVVNPRFGDNGSSGGVTIIM